MKVFCHHCKKINEGLIQIGRRDECSFCKSDLHVCKNCQMFDLKSYNECKETSADRVKEKEKANFCDFFKALDNGSQMDAKTKLLSAAEALFKKSNT